MGVSEYATEVRAEWIDYNGHFSEGYYVLVFGFATDEAMAALGLGEDYRAASGCSLYTVESHVRYLSEVGLGAQLRIATEVIGAAERKLQLAHTMYAGNEIIATEELLALHVDQAAGRAVPLPAEVRAAAEARLSPAPDWSGRRVGL